MDQSIYLLKGQEILRRLNELGYEAYFVGGVVRDQILKIPFTDIDITTSATPEQVLEVVPDANREYMDLGVISFTVDEMDFEITTFRTEEYTNIRKPSQVHYSKKLREDLDRRDYTINALAMSPNGKIYDLCEGTKDLKNKTIRIIGKGKVRFKEDPLRILRAFRLVSKLNFKIEQKTASALIATRKEVAKLSEAKVITELTKIFQGQFAKKALKQMIDAGIDNYLPLEKKAIRIISKKINKITIEEAFAIGYKVAGKVSERANFSHNSQERLKKIIEVSSFLEESQADAPLIFKYGKDIVLSADTITKAILGHRYKSQARDIERISCTLSINTLSELAFKGQDVLEITGGKSGPIIGMILSALEEKVIAGTLLNEYSKLREYAKVLYREYSSREEQRNKNYVTETPVAEETERVEAAESFIYSPPSAEQSIAEKEAQLRKEWQILMIDRYKQDYDKMVNANIDNLPNAAMLTPEERANLASQIGPNIRQLLININLDYQKLAKEGII